MFAYPLPSILTHFQPILIENLSNPIRINPKSIYFPCLGSIVGVILFLKTCWLAVRAVARTNLSLLSLLQFVSRREIPMAWLDFSSKRKYCFPGNICLSGILWILINIQRLTSPIVCMHKLCIIVARKSGYEMCAHMWLNCFLSCMFVCACIAQHSCEPCYDCCGGNVLLTHSRNCITTINQHIGLGQPNGQVLHMVPYSVISVWGTRWICWPTLQISRLVNKAGW